MFSESEKKQPFVFGAMHALYMAMKHDQVRYNTVNFGQSHQVVKNRETNDGQQGNSLLFRPSLT